MHKDIGFNVVILVGMRMRLGVFDFPPWVKFTLDKILKKCILPFHDVPLSLPRFSLLFSFGGFPPSTPSVLFLLPHSENLFAEDTQKKSY